MRILVAHNVKRGRNGGMNRIMGFIHDRVSAAGHFVEEFTADDAPQAASSRWERFAFPRAIVRHAIDAFRVGRGYNVINVHEPVAAAVIRERARIGEPHIVVTSHGVEQRAWELALEEGRLGRGGPSWKTRLIHPLTRLRSANYSLRNASHIFCLNTDDATYIQDRFGRRGDEITRIFPGADPVYGRAGTVRDYLRCTTLLFAGSWRKNKGIQDFIPAFTCLAERHPSLQLIIFGSGLPDGAVLSDFPAKVHERITFRAGLSESDFAAVYADADILVLPSLFEGTPLVLIEAMMSGLPIVTTATCGMKDLISDDNNGCLIPMRSPDCIVSAVERLLADRALRERFGRNAYINATDKYSWDTAAIPVLAVYQRIQSAQAVRARSLGSEPPR